MERKWNEADSITRSNTLVITCDDSVYHYNSKCDSILISDPRNFCVYYTREKEKYRLMTEEEAISIGYKLCKECDRTDYIIIGYDGGDIVDWEVAEEYAKEYADGIY